MVSIIIPSYNRAEFLTRALQSVRDQVFQDWETIVVDDGSEDDSRQVIESLHDDRIRYIYQPHKGVSAARNAGIRLAKFSWLCFLDSDDYWKPRKLQRQLEEIENRPGYAITYTDEIWIRRNRRVNPRKIHCKYAGWIYHHCLPLCIISPSSVMIHRRIFEAHGLFDESLPVCEDYEMWLRLSAHHPIHFLVEPLTVKVGGHRDQLSHSLWGMDRYRVRTLVKMMQSGGLSHQQKVWTAREICKKAAILVTGFEKRGKFEQARIYRTIIGKWSGQPKIAAR